MQTSKIENLKKLPKNKIDFDVDCKLEVKHSLNLIHPPVFPFRTSSLYNGHINFEFDFDCKEKVKLKRELISGEGNSS